MIPFFSQLDKQSQQARTDPEAHASEFATTALTIMGAQRFPDLFESASKRLTQGEINVLRGKKPPISDQQEADAFNAIVDFIQAAPATKVNAREVHAYRAILALGAPHFISTARPGTAQDGLRPVEAVVTLYLLAYNAGLDPRFREAVRTNLFDHGEQRADKATLQARTLQPEQLEFQRKLSSHIIHGPAMQLVVEVNKVLSILQL